MSLKNSAEISWFAPICDGDDDFLGNRNPLYKSSWENTCKIVQTAEKFGYKNVLCPSSFQVGQARSAKRPSPIIRAQMRWIANRITKSGMRLRSTTGRARG